MSASTLALVAAMVVLVSHLHGPVQAYLDPGTGSIIIQAVLAGVVGGIALVKLYWSRLKGLMTGRTPKRENDD
jgi:hypothetical protein